MALEALGIIFSPDDPPTPAPAPPMASLPQMRRFPIKKKQPPTEQEEGQIAYSPPSSRGSPPQARMRRDTMDFDARAFIADARRAAEAVASADAKAAAAGERVRELESLLAREQATNAAQQAALRRRHTINQEAHARARVLLRMACHGAIPQELIEQTHALLDEKRKEADEQLKKIKGEILAVAAAQRCVDAALATAAPASPAQCRGHVVAVPVAVPVEQPPVPKKKTPPQPLSRRDRGALLELGRENVSGEALAFDHRPKKNKKTKRGRKPDWKKAAYYTAKYAAKANACDYLLDN